MTGSLLFPTAIGTCGVAWRGEALTAVALPERDEHRLRRRLGSPPPGRVPATDGSDGTAGIPAAVSRAVAAMTALLDGTPDDLTWVDIDLDLVGEFERAVYRVTRSIGPGESLTYGQVAAAVGQPGGAQAVGRALGANRWPIVVPCHRVLGAGGDLTGFSASGGVATKRRMLLIEGCPAVPPSLFD